MKMKFTLRLTLFWVRFVDTCMITNYILIRKKCFMHFHPILNSKSRLTFAIIRPHGSGFTLNLGDKKVKKLTMLNF